MISIKIRNANVQIIENVATILPAIYVNEPAFSPSIATYVYESRILDDNAMVYYRYVDKPWFIDLTHSDVLNVINGVNTQLFRSKSALERAINGVKAT